ncbi:hypothetical protein, partial [Aeromonas caviae]|uniref:hypothetical protein n=1 Tax=Aeromonas caviae TaxID=648 RepID=UPI001CC3FAC7
MDKRYRFSLIYCCQEQDASCKALSDGAHRRQIEQNDVIRRQRRERGPLGVPLVFDTDNRGR